MSQYAREYEPPGQQTSTARGSAMCAGGRCTDAATSVCSSNGTSEDTSMVSSVERKTSGSMGLPLQNQPQLSRWRTPVGRPHGRGPSYARYANTRGPRSGVTPAWSYGFQIGVKPAVPGVLPAVGPPNALYALGFAFVPA